MRRDQLTPHRREQARRRLGLPASASDQTIAAALRSSIDVSALRDLGLPATATLQTIQAALRARSADGRFEVHDGAAAPVESHEAFMDRQFPALVRQSRATAKKTPTLAQAPGRPGADLAARQGAGQRDFSW